MKIKKIIFLIVLLIIISTSYTIIYNVPRKPASIDVADIDLDGDKDIVLGHNANIGDYWGMISILENIGYGEFTIIDTLPTYHYENSIKLGNVNGNEYPDIIAQDYDNVLILPYFFSINDFHVSGWNDQIFGYYDLITVDNYSLHKSENLNFSNIVFISYSNGNNIWGITYNENGQFSEPIYYNLDYPPSYIAVGDLNQDESEDIIIPNGSNLDAWLNLPAGLEYYNISANDDSHDIKIVDIDNDNDNDLVGTNWGAPGSNKQILIYTNHGDMDFEITYIKTIFEGLAEIFLSDLNNDGLLDIIYNCSMYFPNNPDEIFNTYILFQNLDGSFQDPVTYYTGICSHKSHAADLDGNGWNDIITLNYDFYNPPPDTCTIHILFNDGTGNFVEEPQVDANDNFVMNIENCRLSNYPNPFNPLTTISFDLPVSVINPVLEIFNIKGKKIRTFNCYNRTSIIWNGTDKFDKLVSSGVYIYRIKSKSGVLKSKKMLLIK